MTGKRIVYGQLLTAFLSLALLFISVSTARSETLIGPVKEIPFGRLGWEINESTKGNFCLVATEACQPALSSSQLGGFGFAQGVSVDNDTASPHYGHLYVIDGSRRIEELEANGKFVSTFGWDVNKTKVEAGSATQQEMNVCTETEITKGSECQPGTAGGAPGQFGENQESIVSDPTTGDIYVTDLVKENLGGITVGVRVQKFTADGRWVWEVGKEVNETKTAEVKEVDNPHGILEIEENLCTQEEVEANGVKCTFPAQYEFGGTEPSANNTEPGVFSLESLKILAFGGTEKLLYVGGGQRIQEFETNGDYKREIPLTDSVKTMTVDDSCLIHNPLLTESSTPTCADSDPSYGDLYVIFKGATTVHKLDPSGDQVTEFPIHPNIENPDSFGVSALAVDPLGRLAAGEIETSTQKMLQVTSSFGSLLDGETGHVITEFSIPAPPFNEVNALAFSVNDEVYATSETEVLTFSPKSVAELIALPEKCTPGTENDTSATVDCTLSGEVDPWGVSETEVLFRWGRTTALGEETSSQPIKNVTDTPVEGVEEPFVPVSAVIQGVRPNESFFYYGLAGHDHNVKAPEVLTSEPIRFTTPLVPPWVGTPSASFITSSSAVLFDELNPENSSTKYFFEYAVEREPGEAGYKPGEESLVEKCPKGVKLEGAACKANGVLATTAQQSAAYGKIGTTLEATELQPSRLYRYRLVAENENAAKDEKLSSLERPSAEFPSPDYEGSFRTAPAPRVSAETGSYSLLDSTSVVVAGSVDPDGQPATYAFEIGVYDGAATQYGIVFSGPIDASTTPVEEKLTLTGLQPGTEYAYRITIKSGYGESAGKPQTFSTQGLPSVLPVVPPLAMLPVPAVTFPSQSKVTSRIVKCKRGYELNKHGKCVKSKPKKKTTKARKKPVTRGIHRGRRGTQKKTS